MAVNQTVGILIFEDVELLDFTGPYEVFSVSGRLHQDAYTVFTVAQTERVRSSNGLSVIADYRLADAPKMDLLLVPGGRGTREAVENAELIHWLQRRAGESTRLLSVCTGVFLLAKAGLVDGLSLTTHNSAFDELAELAPNNPLVRDQRVLDHGRTVISAGISAGIDMAFHVVTDRLGEDKALATAQYMEYDWHGKS